MSIKIVLVTELSGIFNIFHSIALAFCNVKDKTAVLPQPDSYVKSEKGTWKKAQSIDVAKARINIKNYCRRAGPMCLPEHTWYGRPHRVAPTFFDNIENCNLKSIYGKCMNLSLFSTIL